MVKNILLLFILSVLASSTIVAQAPANDDCSGAITLTVSATSTCGGATTGTTVNATQSIAAISCDGYGSPSTANDVWYSFVATSALQTITVVSASGYQAIADLRSGACNGTNINCAVAASAGGSAVINATGLTIGNTYYVRVYYYSGTTTFTICVTTPQPPANDNCSGATTLTVSSTTSCGGATTGTTVNATQSIPAIGCEGNTASSANDVWYSFVATSTEHDITVAGSSSDLLVADLRSGGCNGTNINCSMAFNSSSDTVTIDATGLTVGSTYYVRVYYYSGGAYPFTICVTTPQALANDNCSGAIMLTVSSTSSCGGETTGTTVNATQSIAPIDCEGATASSANDVWYSFVATSIEHSITATGSSSNLLVLDVRSGACNGANINCNMATNSSHDTVTINATGLIVGNTYYVRVYYYSAGAYPFTICITTPTRPANDNCSGAIALTVSNSSTCTGAVTGNVKYATESLPAISCVAVDAAGEIGASGASVYTGLNPTDDVWYSFVASSTDQIITVNSSSHFNAIVDVRSGTCNGTNIDCGTDTAAGATIVVSPGDLTIGNTYYVRVYDYSGNPATTTFTICVTTPSADIDAATSSCPRATMVNNYYNKYLTSAVADSQLVWTGDTATCSAGTISVLAQTRTLARINYFRELVGLPGNITFTDSLNAKCQQAALMMNVNNQLNHFPPPTWECYTDSGYTAAGNSDLALGNTNHSSNSVSAWMDDFGADNTSAGHRRWIIYSRTGGPHGAGSTIRSSALWMDCQPFGAATIDSVAYPSAGYFPAPLVPTSNRWSFGVDGADFTNATVQMTDNSGANVPTTLETYATSIGDNSIVWLPTGIVTDSAIDLAYTVHVNNVMVNSVSKNYTYTVTICPISYPPQCPSGKSWSENNCACITPCTPVTHTISPTVCAGKSVTVGSSTYAVSGTYTNTLTSYKGCDSTVTTNLTVLPANTFTQSPTVCAGKSVTVGTTTYTVSGTFTNTLTSKVSGCDSTVTTNLTVLPANTHTQSPTVCPGGSVVVGTNTYTVSGTYTNTFTASNGCDSTIITKLTVYPANSSFTQSLTVCPGHSVTVGPSTYSVTGTFTNTLTSSVGCGDSVVTTYLTVLPTNTFTQSPVICTGHSVTVGTSTYSVTGSFTNTLTSYQGCDSIVTTNLTVNALPVVSSTITPSPTICAGTSVTLNGTGASTYIWSGGITDGNPFVPAVGTTTYTVTGTTNNCSSTTTKSITVNALPVVSSTITTSTTVCAGTSVTLNGTGASTYTWSGGITDGSAFVPAVGTTTYTVTGTTNNCSSTTTKSITVNALPVVGSTITTSTTVCSGTSVTLNGTGASTYTWSGGITDGTAFVPAAGTTTYTVTGTTNNCSSTTTKSITVNPSPVVSSSVTALATVCSGTSVTLSGTGASTYNWSGGVTNGSAFVPAVGSTTYTVTGTTNNCSSTNTKSITVNPLPAVSSSVTPSAIVCSGASVTLNGTGASTYTWSGGVTNGTAFVPAVGAITYTVTGTDVNTCSNTDTITVTVNKCTATPTITAIGVVLTSSATTGNQWYFNGAIITGATEQIDTATQSGTYTDEVTIGGITSLTSNSVTITIPPTPTITQLGAVLTSSSATGNQWYLNGAEITGATGQTYTETSKGTYTVKVTINGVSSSLSAPDMATGIEQIAVDNALSVYPNPSTGIFYVKSQTLISTIEVMNAIGETILLQQVNASTASVDLSGQAKGLYFYKVSGNANILGTGKMIIE